MVFVIVVIIVVALWIYFKLFCDPSDVRAAYKGKTPDQKAVIRYFLIDGCLRKKLSDAEYDALVLKFVPDLKQQAMDKIGLDEDQLKEIEPVHFENYVFDTANYSKKGDDGIWRSSKYQVTWLFFSDSQVYLYQKTMSFDEKKDEERTEEFFYKDITSLSTITTLNEVKLHGKKGMEEVLQVESTQFKLVVPGNSLFCAMTKNDYTESAVQGMKAKLREKKLAQ
jgi:hypothetical protein